MKARRSALYVPADNLRALEKARMLDADVLILDLEDAVAPDAKAQARANAVAAVRDFPGRETVIRINAAGTPWHDADMAAALAAKPDAVLLPKVNGAGDIPVGPMAVWAMIETPGAVLNAQQIARAGAACLVLGANDLLKEMRARHRPDRANLAYAMSHCVLVARAHRIAVLDGVHNRIDDADAFTQACEMARDFGFDGKTLIHPSQIALCHAVFVPSADEVDAARRVLAAFADNPGKGAIRLDGQMVETLDAEIAVALLARAKADPRDA